MLIPFFVYEQNDHDGFQDDEIRFQQDGTTAHTANLNGSCAGIVSRALDLAA